MIAKRLDGVYQPGERAMLKVKKRRTAGCVVGAGTHAFDSFARGVERGAR